VCLAFSPLRARGRGAGRQFGNVARLGCETLAIIALLGACRSARSHVPTSVRPSDNLACPAG
jgi:hypothetical protein